MNTIDVVELEPGMGGLREQLLNGFRKAFARKVLYEKKGRRYYSILPGVNGTLFNEGYFINKQAIQELLDAVTAEEGGVWINLALGNTRNRGAEIQLVLTAVDSDAEIDPNDLGLRCVTTAEFGEPTDPPTAGNPTPRGR